MAAVPWGTILSPRGAVQTPVRGDAIRKIGSKAEGALYSIRSLEGASYIPEGALLLPEGYYYFKKAHFYTFGSPSETVGSHPLTCKGPAQTRNMGARDLAGARSFELPPRLVPRRDGAPRRAGRPATGHRRGVGRYDRRSA